MVNKKGQQMTLGTIIAIVLGIAVLVFLIFGFSTGWNNLWEKVTQFGGGDVNVDTVVQACALQCSTGNEYGFNNEQRTVVIDGGFSATSNCSGFAGSMQFKKGEESKAESIGVSSCSF
jgi:tRNA(His) 5'-end guanylyltransferase